MKHYCCARLWCWKSVTPQETFKASRLLDKLSISLIHYYNKSPTFKKRSFNTEELLQCGKLKIVLS